MVQFRYFIRHLFASHVAHHDIIDLKLVRLFFCFFDSLSRCPPFGPSGKLSLLLASTCVRTLCNKYVASNFEIKKNISIYCRLQLRSWLLAWLLPPPSSLCQPTGQLPTAPSSASLLLFVNRLWDRLQLQLHHKSFSSSLQVASQHFSSRTCHMLPNVEIPSLFSSFLSLCRCIFQINSDPPARTRPSHPFRCLVEVHATPTMRSPCPATSLFHLSSLIYGPASNKIMLYSKYSSARKLRPCIFETSNRFSSTYFSSFEKLSLFVHWPRVATQCNSVSVSCCGC